jgi:hypothetical protein
MMDQPKVTDFTTVVPAKDSGFHVRVKLESRWVTVGTHISREEAETAELAINQAMIEYRTKRNSWEKQMKDQPQDEGCKHEPDFGTITPAECVVDYHGRVNPEDMVCDVSCRHCGRSGSFPIPVEDIQW